MLVQKQALYLTFKVVRDMFFYLAISLLEGTPTLKLLPFMVH